MLKINSAKLTLKTNDISQSSQTWRNLNNKEFILKDFIPNVIVETGINSGLKGFIFATDAASYVVFSKYICWLEEKLKPQPEYDLIPLKVRVTAGLSSIELTIQGMGPPNALATASYIKDGGAVIKNSYPKNVVVHQNVAYDIMREDEIHRANVEHYQNNPSYNAFS